MDIDVTAAARALMEHPAPALPLDELLVLVGHHDGPPPPPREEFRRAIGARPDLFLLLDPWQGPWIPFLERENRHRSARNEPFGPWGLRPAVPWVVVRPDARIPTPDAQAPNPAGGRRLRSSRWRPTGRPRTPPPGTTRVSTRAGTSPSSSRPPRHGTSEDRAKDPPASEPPRASPALRHLRDSFRWYALTVDGRSATSVARWTRMVRQERELRAIFHDGEGDDGEAQGGEE